MTDYENPQQIEDISRLSEKPENKNRSGIVKSIGRVLLKIGAFLGTFLVTAIVIISICLGMVCSDAFPSAQSMFVTTILETGQLKFLANIFLSSEKIQEIVDSNSMKKLDAEVDTDLIQIGNSGGVDLGDKGDETVKERPDIEIIEISGATYSGTLMIVKDPSRI